MDVNIELDGFSFGDNFFGDTYQGPGLLWDDSQDAHLMEEIAKDILGRGVAASVPLDVDDDEEGQHESVASSDFLQDEDPMLWASLADHSYSATPSDELLSVNEVILTKASIASVASVAPTAAYPLEEEKIALNFEDNIEEIEFREVMVETLVYKLDTPLDVKVPEKEKELPQNTDILGLLVLEVLKDEEVMSSDSRDTSQDFPSIPSTGAIGAENLVSTLGIYPLIPEDEGMNWSEEVQMVEEQTEAAKDNDDITVGLQAKRKTSIIETKIVKLEATERQKQGRKPSASRPKSRRGQKKSPQQKAKDRMALQKFRQNKKLKEAEMGHNLVSLKEAFYLLSSQVQALYPESHIQPFIEREFKVDLKERQVKRKKAPKAKNEEEKKSRKREQDRICAKIYRMKGKHEQEMLKEEVDYYQRLIPTLVEKLTAVGVEIC